MHYAHILYVGKQNRQKYFLFPKFWRYFQFGVRHIMNFFSFYLFGLLPELQTCGMF